ncbi:DUF1877 family protein [Pseudarthrobacter sp. J75]|uniref:DUF1877 family protein n=1 Tax=unclassified Pseudarthrobacter TaxID=2647000 RepID=UPI002E800673|nr:MULTISPECIES: DUF1877 family protein [unclassified Pseudarthrobacter]MEE2521270.1 DUF1877 family protein [Pseudarthrobacter sp. J47]MEE2528502.1 DUF1877 family protein [Pseudarthrobacter sp. J75]
MGIRYYAYAFDGNLTDQALADPLAFLSADPLADAWGLEPGADTSFTTFKQTVPDRDMLYLDKAWRQLQCLTARVEPGLMPRCSYRMFEGTVEMDGDGMGWEPWVRALTPPEVLAVARDLEEVQDADVESWLRESPSSMWDFDTEFGYVVTFLRKARTFTANLAAEGRGMVYMIG